MTKTTKAVLLATFVFPGVGHTVFKKYVSAAFFISVAVAATIAIMSYVITKAKSIADRILSGEVEPDIMTIRGLIVEQPSGTQGQLIEIATVVLFVVWLLSIADAYRIGRIVERPAG